MFVKSWYEAFIFGQHNLGEILKFYTYQNYGIQSDFEKEIKAEKRNQIFSLLEKEHYV